VTESLIGGTGHRSNQGKVWEEVDKQQTALGVSSQTSAMADSFVANQQQLDEVASQFLYAEGAVGLVVALGDKIVAVEVFDKAATCRKVWRRLLSGFILDAVEPSAGKGQVAQATVEAMLAAVRNCSWEQVQPVGDGEEYRLKSADGTQASALAFGEVLVHGSLLTGA
jgi:hypothetical protein